MSFPSLTSTSKMYNIPVLLCCRKLCALPALADRAVAEANGIGRWFNQGTCLGSLTKGYPTNQGHQHPFSGSF